MYTHLHTRQTYVAHAQSKHATTSWFVDSFHNFFSLFSSMLNVLFVLLLHHFHLVFHKYFTSYVLFIFCSLFFTSPHICCLSAMPYRFCTYRFSFKVFFPRTFPLLVFYFEEWFEKKPSIRKSLGWIENKKIVCRILFEFLTFSDFYRFSNLQFSRFSS